MPHDAHAATNLEPSPAVETAAATADQLAAAFGMTPAAPPQRSAEHHLEEATVVRMSDEGGVHVHMTASASPLAAKQAASCLLAPTPGDTVLVSLREDGRAYVLAVLERGDEGATGVAELGVARHKGDTTLRAGAGTLRLEGAEGLHLVAREALRLSAARAELVAGTLTATAKRAMASLEEAGLAGKSLDTAVERVTTRAARAFRFISETDRTRAKHIDAHASDTARLSSSSTASVTAREVVKVDGAQVLIG